MAGRKPGKASWPADVTISKGLDALDFAMANRADVEPRLSAGVLDGLAADLGLIGAKIPAALQKRLAIGVATQSERVSAATTKKLLAKLRRAVTQAPPGSVDGKAFGLGMRADDRVNKTIVAAGNVFLDQAARAPEQVRAAGIIAADVARLAAGIAELSGKNDAQGVAKRSSKAATRERDATLARIEQAVRSISAAGDLAYDDDPREEQARALIPEPKAKKKPQLA